MNTGHFWRPEEDEALRRDWGTSRLGKTEFAGQWGKSHKITPDAVRARMTKMRLPPHTEQDAEEESATYEEGEDFINVICASRRMLTKEQIIEQFCVDTTQWDVDRFEVKTSEGYRKDRSVEWHVRDGEVTRGDVSDSGKMLVVPLYHIKVKFIRKTQEIRGRAALEDLIRDAKRQAPKYPALKHKPSRDAVMYEIGMPDLHFGRLTWGEETGKDYDIQIAEKAVDSVLSELLSRVSSFGVDRILLPIGNDFFNVNNKEEETSHGTRQQEDTRWQKTFRAGRLMATKMIDACATIAPVDVVIVPGNHDEERIFYLGDALECWYHNQKRVKIDNRPPKRKYYTFGANLIGLTHGYYERMNNLPAIMPLEVPELWAGSKFREWHTGDKHHKSDMVQKVDEQLGVVVRILRSLAPADAWTFDKGFVGAVNAAEGFVWHPRNGMIAQFTALP